MEIIAIYPQYIYSIQYDDQKENEYDRLFDLWNDVEYITQFLEDNQEYLSSEVWQQTPVPEEAALQVLEEATKLEELFDSLYNNVLKGRKPDFDDHFLYLEGDYK